MNFTQILRNVQLANFVQKGLHFSLENSGKDLEDLKETILNFQREVECVDGQLMNEHNILQATRKALVRRTIKTARNLDGNYAFI